MSRYFKIRQHQRCQDCQFVHHPMGLALVSSCARLLKAGIRGDGALFAQTMLRRLTRNSQLQGCQMACFELLLFRPNSKFRSRSCAGAADSPQ